MSDQPADAEPVWAYNGPPIARRFFGLFGIKITRHERTESDDE